MEKNAQQHDSSKKKPALKKKALEKKIIPSADLERVTGGRDGNGGLAV
jgi:hypothetical protein